MVRYTKDTNEDERLKAVDDPQYRYVPEERTDRSLAWLPFLLIPVFLLLAWWAFSPNQSFNQQNQTEFGVGGAPGDVTSPAIPTATNTPIPMETITPTEDASEVLTPTNFPRNNL